MSTRSKTAARNEQSEEINLKAILGGLSNKLDSIIDVLHQIAFQQRKEYEHQEITTERVQSTIAKMQHDVSKVTAANEKRSEQQNVLTNRRKIQSTWQK